MNTRQMKRSWRAPLIGSLVFRATIAAGQTPAPTGPVSPDSQVSPPSTISAEPSNAQQVAPASPSTDPTAARGESSPGAGGAASTPPIGSGQESRPVVPTSSATRGATLGVADAPPAASEVNAAAVTPSAAAGPIGIPPPAPRVDADVQAFLQEVNTSEPDVLSAVETGPTLSVYGFADFGYTHELKEFAFSVPFDSFLVGNLNLYADADLGKGWRSLVEFRLLYAPHGYYPTVTPGTQPQRIDTTVGDPADYQRPLRWGGIEIERAFLEYQAHALITIRAGQWLTPYGVWNVDHGSPTIIGVRRPFVIGAELLPERQTGLLGLGSFYLGETQISYQLGLSNGRGPIDSYQDLDHNKALTGRLAVATETPLGRVVLGSTAFRGRYTDSLLTFGTGSDGNFETSFVPQTRYEEFSIGFDLKWTLGNFALQSEALFREVAYSDQVPRPVTGGFGPSSPPGYVADRWSNGLYVLAWYRLPWLGVAPFLGGESYDPNVGFPAVAVWGGLNVQPAPTVALKAQLTRSWLSQEGLPDNYNGLMALDLQAAWSF